MAILPTHTHDVTWGGGWQWPLRKRNTGRANVWEMGLSADITYDNSYCKETSIDSHYWRQHYVLLQSFFLHILGYYFYPLVGSLEPMATDEGLYFQYHPCYSLRDKKSHCFPWDSRPITETETISHNTTKMKIRRETPRKQVRNSFPELIGMKK